MNKKIVSIMIMLSIFLSTFATSRYALGEELVLPSGLKFGMSVSQATAVSGYNKYGLEDTFFEAYFKECNYDFSTEARLQGEATVGELPATVNVFFDGKGLKQVKYSFPVSENGLSSIVSDISASYDYVEASLQSKYGNPLDVTTHKHAYMPVVDKSLYFSWFLSIFGGAYTSTETESISNTKHTLRSISLSVRAAMSFTAKHRIVPPPTLPRNAPIVRPSRNSASLANSTIMTGAPPSGHN